MSMNIYAEKGTKVIFENLENGCGNDVPKALKYLTPSNIYTVRKTVVGSWHTDVFLEEVPSDVSFNSVLFNDVK